MEIDAAAILVAGGRGVDHPPKRGASGPTRAHAEIEEPPLCIGLSGRFQALSPEQTAQRERHSLETRGEDRMAARNSCSGRSPWSRCSSFARPMARKPWNPDPCWAAGHTAVSARSSGASIRHSRRSDRGCLLATLLSVGLWFAVFAAKDGIRDRIAGFGLFFSPEVGCGSSRAPVNDNGRSPCACRRLTGRRRASSATGETRRLSPRRPTNLPGARTDGVARAAAAARDKRRSATRQPGATEHASIEPE